MSPPPSRSDRPCKCPNLYYLDYGNARRDALGAIYRLDRNCGRVRDHTKRHIVSNRTISTLPTVAREEVIESEQYWATNFYQGSPTIMRRGREPFCDRRLTL